MQVLTLFWILLVN